MKAIPRAVIALGAASLLTDLSSEMIYPLLPAFLAGTLGAGTAALGLIEGAAESTASVLKLVSGLWTDRTRRRKPLILLGYGLAGLMRPLVGLASSWGVVLAIRVSDRIGKGLRTSPRDALIADVTEPGNRGAAYGLHRAMDHAGAVAGPLVAAALMAFAGLPMRTVFLLAFVPAAAVIAVLLVAVKEPPRAASPAAEPAVHLGHWTALGGRFHLLLLALFVFTLGNSSDAFLILRLTKSGVPDAWVAVLWSLHNVVKVVATYLGGKLADRVGRRKPILWGWAFYAAVYFALGFLESPAALVSVFLAYGVYFGLTEPGERAWVGDLVPARLRGTAFGYYNLVVGIAALPGSLLFGLLWDAYGPPAAFTTGAALAGAASLLLWRVR